MVINTPAWGTTVADDNRMNRITNISNTGAVLAALDKTKFGIFICTLDGSSLLKDHVYLCNADGNALIDISTIGAHNHTSSTTGGNLLSVFRDNTKFMDLMLTRTQDLKKAQWAESVSGTGTIEDGTGGTNGDRYIRLRPNATSGSAATITYPHLILDWGSSSTYVVKVELENTTSLALHTGVACDTITSADGNGRKVQAEVCTVTNNNWWLRTANGSANSASDTGVAISSAAATAVRIDNLPFDVETDIKVGATTLQKTSNIPVDSSTAHSNLIKHSIKNSTGADRPMRMYGCRLMYYNLDVWL